jgi:hypothetical protein
MPINSKEIICSIVCSVCGMMQMCESNDAYSVTPISTQLHTSVRTASDLASKAWAIAKEIKRGVVAYLVAPRTALRDLHRV